MNKSALLRLHMRKEKSVSSHATPLSIGAFVAKLIGALYRIPLLKIIGSEGLGLYQMVFPVYSLLLDFSGAGFPSAVSSLIGRMESVNGFDKRKLLKTSLIIAGALGLLFSLFMLVFCRWLSYLQGNENAFIAYAFLSPAVFLVGLISCFRGYFQGELNMYPTAISQVLEQAVKLAFGLLLAYLFLPNIPLSAGGSTLAVSISEFVALGYLSILYRKKHGTIRVDLQKREFISYAKTLVKVAIPITLTGIILPLSHVVDSFIIINILSSYRQDATSLYGIFSGAVHSVINLPVSLLYGVAIAVIPIISRQNKDEKNGKESKAIFLTFALSVACFSLTYLFAPTIVKTLFSSLSGEQKTITERLIKFTSPCIILLSVLQTVNGVLIGQNKNYAPIIGLGVGVVVKTITLIALLKIPEINIYACSIASIACYFSACLVNLILVSFNGARNENAKRFNRQFAD